MNIARKETHIDEAVSKYDLTGKGVLVAVLDRGLDWKHPDFVNPDGTTRIKWMLDMTGQNGCEDKTGPEPVEYSEREINDALSSGRPIAERDANGHGTQTFGVAAGNGRAFANGLFRGVAPKSDLLVVKLTSEGAPAHDGVPEEVSFQSCIEAGFNWLDEKIEELGQPVVAQLNSGVQWGPIDGSSIVSRVIDKFFDLERPGRIFVIPSGDEGSIENHSGGVYDASAPAHIRMAKSDQKKIDLQIWYSGYAPALITLALDDGTKVGPVGPGESANREGIEITQYEPGREPDTWSSTSGDRSVLVSITGHLGQGVVIIEGTSSRQGKFDLYGDLAGPRLSAIVTFKDQLVPGRLTDYAATKSGVKVADSVARTTFVDIDGITRDFSDEGLVGHLWKKSSAGPSRDGRKNLVDITAPGQNIFSSLARESWRATLRHAIPKEGGGWYIRFGGTSGSSPIVTGTVALMLQKRPNLTTSQVKDILHSTAMSDSITGATPNEDWGYGRLNALRAISAL